MLIFVKLKQIHWNTGMTSTQSPQAKTTPHHRCQTESAAAKTQHFNGWHQVATQEQIHQISPRHRPQTHLHQSTNTHPLPEWKSNKILNLATPRGRTLTRQLDTGKRQQITRIARIQILRKIFRQIVFKFTRRRGVWMLEWLTWPSTNWCTENPAKSRCWDQVNDVTEEIGFRLFYDLYNLNFFFYFFYWHQPW